METNKTRQQSMFSFVVKMPPQLSVLLRPSPSTKRSINVEASNGCSEAELYFALSSFCHNSVSLHYTAWPGVAVRLNKTGKKLEIQHIQRNGKETKLANVPFELLECSDN